MSSTYVRTTLKDFIQINAPTEKLVDLTAFYGELHDVLSANNIGFDEGWVGIEFIGGDELPITVGANNSTGYYRETGSVQLHVVGVAALGNAQNTLMRAEALRKLLRGQRFAKMYIRSISPANTGEGATIDLDDGYYSASFFMEYEYDFSAQDL